MADSSTEKKRIEEYGVRTVKGRWSEWAMDGNGIECETKEQTSGLSIEDLAWLIEPHVEALLPALLAAARRDADVRTLNGWAQDIQSRWWCVRTVNEVPCCCLFAPEVRDLAVCVRQGATPAEACSKAAAWVREQGIESGKGGDDG